MICYPRHKLDGEAMRRVFVLTSFISLALTFRQLQIVNLVHQIYELRIIELIKTLNILLLLRLQLAKVLLYLLHSHLEFKVGNPFKIFKQSLKSCLVICQSVAFRHSFVDGQMLRQKNLEGVDSVNKLS